ncbi:uncharacterized protein C11orf24 homolog [Camelus ferus]|uniref:Uncharacterized protein C11orf24 homolog n=3 Tax=Camelus TaxID=9836 RepID=A0A8B8TUF1_CAMFR|nr:uncharacterized protein C11orf24 homolog [Camelus bactrianus]XP_032345922.1 uncharacterized protein C11orf24 homolog [Camelus ferus]
MWTALVLLWISSWPLSESQVAPPQPRHSVPNETRNNSVKTSSEEMITRVFDKTTERMTLVTSSPTLTRGTWVGDPTSAVVTAGRTHRTDTATSAAMRKTPDGASSRPPTPPTLASQTPTSSDAHSTPHTWAPGGSMLPSTSPTSTTPTPTTGAQTTASTLASASTPLSTESPGHTPGRSTASPAPPSPQALNVSTQGPTVQMPTAQTGADPGVRPAPTLPNATPEPTSPSLASGSTTAGATTKAPKPAASTAPAPASHTSLAPEVEATTPTTQPSPAGTTPGPREPGTTQTPEQVEPETTPGTASLGPTPGSSGDSKVSATDVGPLSTQGRYLVVSTEPLAQSLVNKSFLLAVLLLGVTLFITVLVLFALQAYESYRKKDYTQVDYLINGMYADSEM